MLGQLFNILYNIVDRNIGNTGFVDDVDAVSGASLLLNEKKELLGEQPGAWADDTGCRGRGILFSPTRKSIIHLLIPVPYRPQVRKWTAGNCRSLWRRS